MYLLDGAMGTLLQKQGYIRPGICPELSNIEHPEAIRDIHRSYIQAGSDFVLTNTYGANRIKLGEYGMESRVREICAAAVANAEAACAGTHVKGLGDMGPTGKFIAPLGDREFEEIYDVYFEQARALSESGADGFIIPDLLPDAADELIVPAKANGLATVFLVAPTSTDGMDGDFSTANAACSVLWLCRWCTGRICPSTWRPRVRLLLMVLVCTRSNSACCR